MSIIAACLKVGIYKLGYSSPLGVWDKINKVVINTDDINLGSFTVEQVVIASLLHEHFFIEDENLLALAEQINPLGTDYKYNWIGYIGKVGDSDVIATFNHESSRRIVKKLYSGITPPDDWGMTMDAAIDSLDPILIATFVRDNSDMLVNKYPWIDKISSINRRINGYSETVVPVQIKPCTQAEITKLNSDEGVSYIDLFDTIKAMTVGGVGISALDDTGYDMLPISTDSKDVEVVEFKPVATINFSKGSPDDFSMKKYLYQLSGINVEKSASEILEVLHIICEKLAHADIAYNPSMPPIAETSLFVEKTFDKVITDGESRKSMSDGVITGGLTEMLTGAYRSTYINSYVRTYYIRMGYRTAEGLRYALSDFFMNISDRFVINEICYRNDSSFAQKFSLDSVDWSTVDGAT